MQVKNFYYWISSAIIEKSHLIFERESKEGVLRVESDGKTITLTANGKEIFAVQ